MFFHKSQVISSITLQSGDKVSFDLVKFKEKYQARQVVYVTTN
ncbi:S1 domain-containing protein [Enterobacter asburiae]